ncbi:hypothetical protein [Oceanirhabdus sp. W0125-5]|nr:hypothetical protein [Oceanirhabdus sp. W0125-5]WBW96867.1 hypothetical protein OW730_24730 [Oceanirhabdus sp. W0125-5]
MRIINGPNPFDKCGSGPFQLCIFIGLIMLSIVFFAISFLIKNKTKGA